MKRATPRARSAAVMGAAALAAVVGLGPVGCARADSADVSAAGAGAEPDAPLRVARLTDPRAWADPVVPLPRILDPADAERYRQVFAAQRAGDWARADRVVATVSDPLLVGHVLFQRYMHPTAWRSSFDELAGWLRVWADHPGAARIWRLAQRRRPDGAVMPPRPPYDDALVGHGVPAPDPPPPLPSRDLGRKERAAVEALRLAVHGAANRDDPAAAEAAFAASPAQRWLTAAESDALAARIARAWFAAGGDDAAVRLAAPAAKRSGNLVPDAHWIAGLAAWRRDDPRTAARHFSALAEARPPSSPFAASGAFWAARAYEALGRAEAAERMLRAAAESPRSLYGLLALRRLGQRPAFDWDPPRLGAVAARLLERSPAARRAMALAEAGYPAGAEAELRALYPRVGAEAISALVVLAERLGLHAVGLRLGSELAVADGRRHDRALYPVPGWRPDDGFRIDRALIFALARQESMFEPTAGSAAGARGLLQIMPATASEMDGKTDYREGGADALLAPGLNLSLGQRYLDHLMGRKAVSSNLVYLFAAYNAGPSRLAGWRRDLDEPDPLLFLESIPFVETRRFVRRVLANLWIYRFRLGQHADSLDELAAGRWPTYHAHDTLRQFVDLSAPR